MFHCPHCGEPVADDNAQMCPHCGSDDETGWRGDVDYHSLEIPEEWDERDTKRALLGLPASALSRRSRGFLCAIAVLAGVIMLGLHERTRPQTVFAMMLITSGLYGFVVYGRDPAEEH